LIGLYLELKILQSESCDRGVMGVGHHVRLQRVTSVVAAIGLLVMVVVLFVDLLGMSGRAVTSVTTVQYNYSDALMRSLLYFEGQRSGKLPTTQRVTWRGDSALEDGESAGVCSSGASTWFLFSLSRILTLFFLTISSTTNFHSRFCMSQVQD
jgi:hypothetical protein